MYLVRSRPGLHRSIRFGRAALLVNGQVFGLEAEVGQNVFHRNALATVLHKPGLTLAEAAPVFAGYWLVICRRIGYRMGHGIGMDVHFGKAPEALRTASLR